jgi:carbon-monoxide dehydrogenase medium subunit
MRAFDLYSPTSLPEALSLITELNGEAVPLAGGTNLLLQMRSGEVTPRAVVSLRRLEELDGMSFDPRQGLRLGARLTLRQLTRSPIVRQHYPCLAQAAAVMASEQIRSLATVGGNLCNAAPSADLAPPLLVLDAQVRLVGPTGDRRMPLEAFFLGPGRTARAESELLVDVLLPPPDGTAVYLKHSLRAYMDNAVAGVAVRRIPSNGHAGRVHIALGAVAPVPMIARRAQEALQDGDGSPAAMARAAAAAAEECSPIDDVRASASYRRRLVEILVRRGLEAVHAGGGERVGR